MHTVAKRRQRDDRGAAAVEFALVMPLLVLLLVGIVNFGFILAQQLALSNAARQAARTGVVVETTCAEMAAEAVDAVEPPIDDLATANVAITVGPPGGAGIACSGIAQPCEDSLAGYEVKVVITYTTDVMVANFIPGLGSTKALDGKGVFRCEWS